MYGEIIKTVIVGPGGATTIDFTSIPSVYTDLLIVLSGRATSTSANISIKYNGSTANYAGNYLQGDGNSTSYATTTTFIGYLPISSTTANTFSNTRITILNYTAATNKTYSIDHATENNSTNAYQEILRGLWSDTSAIASITLTASNFAQYSTATLYGLTKGSGGATVA